MTPLPIKLNLEIIQLLSENNYRLPDLSLVPDEDLLSLIPELQDQPHLPEHLSILRNNKFLADSLFVRPEIQKIDEPIENFKNELSIDNNFLEPTEIFVESSNLFFDEDTNHTVLDKEVSRLNAFQNLVTKYLDPEEIDSSLTNPNDLLEVQMMTYMCSQSKQDVKTIDALAKQNVKAKHGKIRILWS